MKVTAEHFAALSEAIKPLDTPERRQAYREGRFERSDQVKDLNKRYRWDLFWLTKKVNGLWPFDHYNDSHLDTALRAIVPTLKEAA